MEPDHVGAIHHPITTASGRFAIVATFLYGRYRNRGVDVFRSATMGLRPFLFDLRHDPWFPSGVS
jgi:hypothetical protein